MTVVRFTRAWTAPLGIVLSATLILAPPPCRASTAVVPDDYPTIQAAIDSPADTIQVRAGTYVENLAIRRNVEVDALASVYSTAEVHGSVAIYAGGLGTTAISGFHVCGPVTVGGLAGEGRAVIIACLVDSGIAGARDAHEPWYLTIRDCTIKGDITAGSFYTVVSGNTVIGGTLATFSDGGGCCGRVKQRQAWRDA